MKKILKLFVRTRDYWSIGIYAGVSPFHLITPKGIKNPILTAKDVVDISALFVADPFMMYEGGSWNMFFEVFNRRTKKGEIGLAISNDGWHWRYQQIVLNEKFHLSYPYVFKCEGRIYMIPESYEAKAIRLYEAELFPFRWKFIGNILSGFDFIDSSVFNYGNKWWLFTCPTINSDILELYYAKDLRGPWHDHPSNPIIKGNAHIARCGGRVLVSDDRILRYAQDDQPVFGNSLHVFEIIKLTINEYEEKGYSGNPLLRAGRKGWNSRGMHCIDPHQLSKNKWIACVDGNRRLLELKIIKEHKPRR